jgi:hypothetical protein
MSRLMFFVVMIAGLSRPMAASAQPAAAGRPLVSSMIEQAVAEQPAEATPDDEEGPGRRKLWTGVGLVAGGAMFLVQSFVFFPDGCGSYNDQCSGAQRAFRFLGGTLTATGVSLIVLHGVEQRRPRVALALAPRAVRVSVDF